MYTVPFAMPVKLSQDELGVEDANGVVLVPNMAYRYDIEHVNRQRKIAHMIVEALNHTRAQVEPAMNGKRSR